MQLSKAPEIERFLKSPDPSVRVALIHGRDRSGVGERAERLCKTVTPDLNDPFNVSLLTESDVEADDGRLEDALSALSMMGGRRLVRLRLGGERVPQEKALAALVKAHTDGQFNPDAVWVIEAGNLGRDSALRRAAEGQAGAVGIVCYEDETGDVARMTREALQADNVSLTREALDHFVSRLPRERGLMRQELERLILYIGPGSGRQIDETELEAHLGVEPQASFQDAAQQAFGGKAAACQAALRRAFAEGEAAVAAVRAAGQHLGRLRRISAAIAGGQGAREAAKSAGVFWKQEAEILRQVKVWSQRDLQDVTEAVALAEVRTKTTGLPDRLITERLFLEIAARARRLGL